MNNFKIYFVFGVFKEILLIIQNSYSASYLGWLLFCLIQSSYKIPQKVAYGLIDDISSFKQFFGSIFDLIDRKERKKLVLSKVWEISKRFQFSR